MNSKNRHRGWKCTQFLDDAFSFPLRAYNKIKWIFLRVAFKEGKLLPIHKNKKEWFSFHLDIYLYTN